MRIVHLTAGAGGRICGSCLHDNGLVKAPRARGYHAVMNASRSVVATATVATAMMLA